MEKLGKQIILYGLGGPEKNFRALKSWTIFENDISIDEINRQTAAMILENPSIVEVYAIDNRRGLKGDFERSIKHPGVEAGVLFRDLLERCGLLVYTK